MKIIMPEAKPKPKPIEIRSLPDGTVFLASWAGGVPDSSANIFIKTPGGFMSLDNGSAFTDLRWGGPDKAPSRLTIYKATLTLEEL